MLLHGRLSILSKLFLNYSATACLLPQDAKDTATIATAIKTNFFIFFAF